jgi:hypothetical protein
MHSRSVFGLNIGKARLMCSEVAPECLAFYLDIVLCIQSAGSLSPIQRTSERRRTQAPSSGGAATLSSSQLPPPANDAAALRRTMQRPSGESRPHPVALLPFLWPKVTWSLSDTTWGLVRSSNGSTRSSLQIQIY